MRIAREWNLTWKLRSAIAACVAAYLLFAQPWSMPDRSTAVAVYTCAVALLVLAVVPNRTRTWVAICLALAVPFFATLALTILHLA